MRQVTLQTFTTIVYISDEYKSKRTIYQVSCTNFTVAIAADRRHAAIRQALINLGTALAQEESLTSKKAEKLLKLHLSSLQSIELAAIISTGSEHLYLLTGRFYREKTNNDDPNGPMVKSNEFILPNLRAAFNWQSDKSSKGTLNYTSDTAADIHKTRYFEAAKLTPKKTKVINVAQFNKGRNFSNDDGSLPPFPVKTVVAGGAISAVAVAAMVMTLTAKYAASHAVVNLVGVKAISLFWPIALGMGSALVLGSLFQYAKQRGLFSCCNIPISSESQTAKPSC